MSRTPGAEVTAIRDQLDHPIVDTAVPGEILVDDAVAAAGVTTDPAGRRMLKGFDEPVAVYSLASDPLTDA